MLSESKIFYIWQPHLFFQLCIPCFEDICFYYFMHTTFEIEHTYVSVHNVNVYEVLSESQRFYNRETFCSFTSMIT